MSVVTEGEAGYAFAAQVAMNAVVHTPEHERVAAELAGMAIAHFDDASSFDGLHTELRTVYAMGPHDYCYFSDLPQAGEPR